MRINIEEISQKSINNGTEATLRLVLSFDEEDYYLYDRLIERLKVSIPEFQGAKLLSIEN